MKPSSKVPTNIRKFSERGAVIIEAVVLMGIVFVVFGATYDILRAVEVKSAMNQAAAVAVQTATMDLTMGTGEIQDLTRLVLREAGQDPSNFEVGVRKFNRVPTTANPTLFTNQSMLQVSISVKTGSPLTLKYLSNPCSASVMYFAQDPGTTIVTNIPDPSCDPAAAIILGLGGTP